jgi:hypothetical protein
MSLRVKLNILTIFASSILPFVLMVALKTLTWTFRSNFFTYSDTQECQPRLGKKYFPSHIGHVKINLSKMTRGGSSSFCPNLVFLTRIFSLKNWNSSSENKEFIQIFSTSFYIVATHFPTTLSLANLVVSSFSN